MKTDNNLTTSVFIRFCQEMWVVSIAELTLIYNLIARRTRDDTKGFCLFFRQRKIISADHITFYMRILFTQPTINK